MDEDLEEALLFLVRAAVVSAHFLELLGISMVTTVIVLLAIEELYEAYTTRKGFLRKVHKVIDKARTRSIERYHARQAARLAAKHQRIADASS